MEEANSHQDGLPESMSTSSLLSSSELFKQTLQIYKKHLFFFSALCLPLLPFYKIALDFLIKLQKTYSLQGYTTMELLFFSVTTIIVLHLIQGILIISATKPTNIFQALLASIKSLPTVVSILFIYQNNDVLFLYLTEDVTIQQAAAKSVEYYQSNLRPAIYARKKFINMILGGSFLSIIPAIITYSFVPQPVFFALYCIFILVSAIGFIIRTIYLSLLFTDIKKKNLSKLSASLAQNGPVPLLSNEKINSFLTYFFNGKINRKAYLIGTIINFVLFCFVIIGFLALSQGTSYSFISFIFSFFVSSFALYYGISLIIRRLRDINKSW